MELEKLSGKPLSDLLIIFFPTHVENAEVNCKLYWLKYFIMSNVCWISFKWCLKYTRQLKSHNAFGCFEVESVYASTLTITLYHYRLYLNNVQKKDIHFLTAAILDIPLIAEWQMIDYSDLESKRNWTYFSMHSAHLATHPCINPSIHLSSTTFSLTGLATSIPASKKLPTYYRAWLKSNFMQHLLKSK